MTSQPARPAESSKSRRGFLQTSAAVLAAGLTVPNAKIASCAHAAGSDLLRVGLIGCGGRGTGAASQALKADDNVQLTALGDMFEDRLQLCLQSLQKIEAVATKLDVPRERQFVGFDAYRQVIDSGVDVVLLATPPHFRPAHSRAAIDAGKHVFAEKPVAVDAPGVRWVLETCELAATKGLSVVSGLCLRYSKGFQALVRACTTAPSVTSTPCRPTITAVRSGSSRGKRIGRTCIGKCATGTISPGCRAISTSNSTFIF